MNRRDLAREWMLVHSIPGDDTQSLAMDFMDCYDLWEGVSTPPDWILSIAQETISLF